MNRSKMHVEIQHALLIVGVLFVLAFAMTHGKDDSAVSPLSDCAPFIAVVGASSPDVEIDEIALCGGGHTAQPPIWKDGLLLVPCRCVAVSKYVNRP